MLVFIAAWIVLCGLMGGKGVHDVVDGAQLVFDQAMDAIGVMQTTNTIMQGAMTNLNIDYDASAMNSAVDSVSEEVGDLEKKVDKYANSVKIAAYVFYSVFLVNLLFGSLSYWTGRGCFSMVMATMAFLLVIVCWLLFAIFYASGAFLDDTCVQLQLWYDCKQPNADQTALGCNKLTLDKEINCPNASTFSGDYTEAYNNLYRQINDYKSRYNVIKFDYPNGTKSEISVSSSTDYNGNVEYRADLYKAEASRLPACSPDGRPPNDYSSSCITNCTSTNLAVPATAECYEKAILSSGDVLMGLSYIASCSYVTDLAKNATAPSSSCDKLGDGFIFQFGSQGSIGILYLFVIFVGVKGYHVWMKKNNAEGKEEYEQKQVDKKLKQNQSAIGSITLAAQAPSQKKAKEREQKYKKFKSTGIDLDEAMGKYYDTWPGAPGPSPESVFQNLLAPVPRTR
jgi:hypothetical protein